MKPNRLVLALLLTTLAGCGNGSDDAGTAPAANPAAFAAGEALFKENCADCHPRGGRGDYLKRIPATLLMRRSEAELMAWIRGSDKHREMPAFTHLSDTETRDLATYLFSEIDRQGIHRQAP